MVILPAQSRYLRTADAAVYCGSTKSTFEKYRLTGQGSVFRKLGRVVVYDVADLDEWMDGKRRLSTSDSGSEAA
jgi:predicted DNA-binding transcriptional regulator AlpA